MVINWPSFLQEIDFMSLKLSRFIFILFLLIPNLKAYPKIKGSQFSLKLERKTKEGIKVYYYFDHESCGTDFSHKDVLVREFEGLSASLWYLLAINKNSRTLEGVRSLIQEKGMEIKIKDKRINQKLESFKKKGVPDAMGNFYLSLLKEKFDLSYEHTKLYEKEFQKVKDNLVALKEEFKKTTVKNETQNQLGHFLLKEAPLHSNIKKLAMNKVSSLESIEETLNSIENDIPNVLNTLTFSKKILSGFCSCTERFLKERKELANKKENQGMSISEKDEKLPLRTLYY